MTVSGHSHRSFSPCASLLCPDIGHDSTGQSSPLYDGQYWALVIRTCSRIGGKFDVWTRCCEKGGQRDCYIAYLAWTMHHRQMLPTAFANEMTRLAFPSPFRPYYWTFTGTANATLNLLSSLVAGHLPSPIWRGHRLPSLGSVSSTLGEMVLKIEERVLKGVLPDRHSHRHTHFRRIKILASSTLAIGMPSVMGAGY